MENQKDKKHICSENKVQLEVGENLAEKSSVIQAQCYRCILQTQKQQEAEEVEGGTKDLAQIAATSAE